MAHYGKLAWLPLIPVMLPPINPTQTRVTFCCGLPAAGDQTRFTLEAIKSPYVTT